MNNFSDILLEAIKATNYLVSSKTLQEFGFQRFDIQKFVESQVLSKVCFGVYCLTEKCPDEFSVLQFRSDKIIYSHSTALYLLGMSDRVPHIVEVTVPQGYNVSKLKRDYNNIKFHYVSPQVWSQGVIQVLTPQGFLVNVYDKERSVCDIIKNKNDIDNQIFIQAIREYFKESRNNRKLVKISRLFNIEDEIRKYIEIF